MSHISEKELACISELLTSEELLIKKFKVLAEDCEDPKMKTMFENISAKHQDHANRLYERLS